MFKDSIIEMRKSCNLCYFFKSYKFASSSLRRMLFLRHAGSYPRWRGLPVRVLLTGQKCLLRNTQTGRLRERV